MKKAKVPVYIRFGEIPESGKSGIYAGDELVGQEPGLSVYRAVESCGMFFPQLPDDANETGIMDYFMFLIQQCKSVYLVTGDEMCFEGQDREPLLMNVKVLKDITHYYRIEYWN